MGASASHYAQDSEEAGMTDTTERPVAPSPTMAQLIDDLQALRARAGDVSYGEIAARITRIRQDRGVPEAAARIARSTVYDAFRPDRRRLNAALVAEIVVALGEDETEAERWRARCIAVRTAARSAARPQGPAPEPPTAPVTPPPGSRWPILPPSRPEPMLAASLFVAALGINLFGGVIVVKFDLPIWLDMVGTAVIAVCLGPWAAVALAVLTICLGSAATSPGGVAFVLVGVVGALVWGYGVRRWGLGRTPARFLLLNIAAAFACTLTSAPITVLVYGGRTEHLLTTGLLERIHTLGADVWQAAIAANIGSSLADKLIAGYVALLVAMALVRYAGTPRGEGPPLGASRRRPPHG